MDISKSTTMGHGILIIYKTIKILGQIESPWINIHFIGE